MKNILSLLILLFSLNFVIAQPLQKYEFTKNIEVGDEKFDEGDYYNALELYKESYKEKKPLSLALRIAEAYYMLKDYKHALRYLKNIAKKDKKGMYWDARLLYAKCMKRLDMYQEAYDMFREYAKKTDDPDGRKEAILEIKGLEMFNSLPDNLEMEFTPLNRDINKALVSMVYKKERQMILYFLGFLILRLKS